MGSQPVATLEKLFAEHASALQAFFRRRIRQKPDAPDLAQEVYLRMLRVTSVELIRNPEAYLYTVASNLVKEQAVLDRRRERSVEVDSPPVALELSFLPTAEDELDDRDRVRRLREVLLELPPKCRAAVAMAYHQDMTYRDIGKELGISDNMVKKYLSQALAHCRRRMLRLA